MKPTKPNANVRALAKLLHAHQSIVIPKKEGLFAPATPATPIGCSCGWNFLGDIRELPEFWLAFEAHVATLLARQGVLAVNAQTVPNPHMFATVADKPPDGWPRDLEAEREFGKARRAELCRLAKGVR